MDRNLEIKIRKKDFSVAQIDAARWEKVYPVVKDGFFCLTKTNNETSLVYETANLPEGAALKVENGWRAFEVCGPLDFELVGVLVQITKPLAENGISIFAISTYDTDYVLVKSENLKQACQALEEEGMTIKEASIR